MTTPSEQIRVRMLGREYEMGGNVECIGCAEKRAHLDTLTERLRVLEGQLIARQVWVDEYAKQTEAALQQRDEAWAELDELLAVSSSATDLTVGASSPPLTKPLDGFTPNTQR